MTTRTDLYLYEDFIVPAFNLNKTTEKLIASIKENELKDYTQVYLNHNFNGENIEITADKIEDNTNKEIRKGYYKQEKLNNMDKLFLFFIFVYIVFFLIVCVLLYRKDEMNVGKKLGIIFVLLFLPLFSTKLLLIILYIMQSFNKKLPKNVYMEKIKFLDFKH
jgi:hypothetical protein